MCDLKVIDNFLKIVVKYFTSLFFYHFVGDDEDMKSKMEIAIKNKIDEKLREWEVSQYSNNTYLYKIPKERVENQKEIIELDIRKDFNYKE